MAQQPDLNSNDGWIEWTGGECPVAAETTVEIKLRSGHTDRDEASHITWFKHDWGARRSDIVAYRVVSA